MKKILLSVAMLGFLIPTAYCQKTKDKKVSTKFLQLPPYDVSTVNPEDLTIEYASEGLTFSGKPKIKDSKTWCKPRGGGLKDAKEITTYYYEVPVTFPEAYLVAKDANGELIYGEQISDQADTSINYGKEECKFWIADALKKDFKKNSSTFQSKEVVKKQSELLEEAKKKANSDLLTSYDIEEFDVYYAKDRNFEYPQLDKAFETAMEAYESLSENGFTKAAYDKLKASIAIWEKEAENLDEEDKNARINKDIGKGLYENLAHAYLYTYQSAKGIRAAKKAIDLFGNFSNNRTRRLDNLINILRSREIAEKANKSILGDMAKLEEIGQEVGTNELSISQLEKDQLNRLKQEKFEYDKSVLDTKIEAQNKRDDADIASGKVNPYDQYVTESATQGKMLMVSGMTLMMSDLKIDGFPEEACEISDLSMVSIVNVELTYISENIKNWKEVTNMDLSNNKITEVPEEIGLMTSLKKLDLSGNPITSIPESIANCTNLKKVKLKKTNLSKAEKNKLENLLPDVKIKF